MKVFCFLLISCFSCLFGDAHPSVFKEYDIRGVVDKEFTVEDSYEMASAIATYIKEKSPMSKTVALGADGRIHSPLIKKQVEKALCFYGFNVVDIGTCTTPVMYFSLYTMPVDAAIMITASHNPGEYNGMKICLGKSSVNGAELRAIRDIYLSKKFTGEASEKGTLQEYNLIERYVDYLASQFAHLKQFDLSAIVDCGNGAAGTVMPSLIEKMGWKNIKLLYGEVDGTYPHHIADPSVEKYMEDLKLELEKTSVDLGVGFDGDCDRMGPMTKAGRLVKGDQLVALLSKTILDEHPGSSVVFDISSSSFLHDLVKKWGGVPVISKTGAAFVKQKMEETNAFLGGEISCHTIFKDRYFGFDDGIYSMMRLFEMIHTTGKSLDVWCEDLPVSMSSPTYRIPCERSICLKIIEKIKEKFSEEKGVEFITEDGLRIHFPNSWAIVRPSNTEPLISIRLEAKTAEELTSLKLAFHEVMSGFIECSVLLE